MNLKNEREELYQDSLKLCTNEDEELLVKTIFILIEKQDKVLAKKLKEECNEYGCWNFKENINKIFGENPT